MKITKKSTPSRMDFSIGKSDSAILSETLS